MAVSVGRKFVVLKMTFVMSGTSLLHCLILGKYTVHFDGGRDAGEEGRVEASEGRFRIVQNGEPGNRFGDATQD